MELPEWRNHTHVIYCWVSRKKLYFTKNQTRKIGKGHPEKNNKSDF